MSNSGSASYALRSPGASVVKPGPTTASRGSRASTVPTSPSSASTSQWDPQRGQGDGSFSYAPSALETSTGSAAAMRRPSVGGGSSPVPLGALAARAAPHIAGAEPLRSPDVKQTETLVNALKYPGRGASPTRPVDPLSHTQRASIVPRGITASASMQLPTATPQQTLLSPKTGAKQTREESARSAHAPSGLQARARSPVRVGQPTGNGARYSASPKPTQERSREQALLMRHLATTLQEDNAAKSQVRHASVRVGRSSAPAQTMLTREGSASASSRGGVPTDMPCMSSHAGTVVSTDLSSSLGGEIRDLLADLQPKLTFPSQVSDAGWQPPLLLTPSVPPPFYWVPCVDTVSDFEVGGAHGEVVTKVGDYEDQTSALPIAGTLRMARGGLYSWTLQIVRQSPHRPQMQFGLHGTNHGRPWRLVSTSRCGRSRDDGPWMPRPGGDLAIVEGDYIHCEVDLRGLLGPLGSFAFAVNDGPFETLFEDIPLSEGPLQPVVAMGGGGTACRVVGSGP